jgi:hypothetical protein
MWQLTDLWARQPAWSLEQISKQGLRVSQAYSRVSPWAPAPAQRASTNQMQRVQLQREFASGCLLFADQSIAGRPAPNGSSSKSVAT